MVTNRKLIDTSDQSICKCNHTDKVCFADDISLHALHLHTYKFYTDVVIFTIQELTMTEIKKKYIYIIRK